MWEIPEHPVAAAGDAADERARAADYRERARQAIFWTSALRARKSRAGMTSFSKILSPLELPPLTVPSDQPMPTFGVVAFAASAGGLGPLTEALAMLPRDFPAAVVVLQHRSPGSRLPDYLQSRLALPVREAKEGDLLRPGVVLVAPVRIHIAVDRGGRVRLLDGPAVNFVRPAADVLFASLADTFRERATAIIMSGYGSDGTRGSRAIRQAGGVVLAQDAATCKRPEMPVSAVDVGKVDLILTAGQIGLAACWLAGCWDPIAPTLRKQTRIESGPG